MLSMINQTVRLWRYEISYTRNGMAVTDHVLSESERDSRVNSYPDAQVKEIDQRGNEWIEGMTFSSREAALAALEEGLEYYRKVKLAEIDAACADAIRAGVEVDGNRYSLADYDPMELIAQLAHVENGAAGIPYHATDELCRIYTAAEFTAVADAAEAHIFYHRTYYNHLSSWIKRCTTTEALSEIVYGSELPEDLAANMSAVLEAAGGAS